MKKTLAFLSLLIAGSALGAYIVWPRLPENIEKRHAVFNDRKVEFLVINLQTQDPTTWGLANDPENPKTVAQWREELGADTVFNAAYFDADNNPTGYFRIDKGESAIPWPTIEEQKKPASYSLAVQVGYWSPLDLTYLPADPHPEPIMSEGFLSFPTLIADAKPMVEKDSGLYTARTIVAEDETGAPYLIITEKGSLTLYEAAQWLAQQPEHFKIAGNLDGGPSTGLSMENGMWDIDISSARVPSVIYGIEQK